MTSTLIALEHWNEHGHHDGHYGFPLVGLAILLVVGFLIIRRRRRGTLCAPGGGSARNVLAERYARGEIDAAEYRARSTVLNERPERPAKK